MQHHPKLQDFEMYVYKCLEKYCSVAKPFRSNYRSLDPIYGFYFDCADFPNQKKKKKKRKAMGCTDKIKKNKKKKKSVILAPLFFPTWSIRRMRDRDKLVERRTGKLCWEIKLIIFVFARTQPSFDQTDDGVEAETSLSLSLHLYLSSPPLHFFSRSPLVFKTL